MWDTVLLCEALVFFLRWSRDGQWDTRDPLRGKNLFKSLGSRCSSLGGVWGRRRRLGPALPLQGPVHPPIITMSDAEATQYLKQWLPSSVPLTGMWGADSYCPREPEQRQWGQEKKSMKPHQSSDPTVDLLWVLKSHNQLVICMKPWK